MNEFRFPRRTLLIALGAASLEGCRCSEPAKKKPSQKAKLKPASTGEEDIVAIVQKFFEKRGLKFENGALLAFAKDAIERNPKWPKQLQLKTKAGKKASRKIQSTLRSTFLLSSDFFQNGADETKPLKYLRWYDPYEAPCMNPLAHSGK